MTEKNAKRVLLFFIITSFCCSIYYFVKNELGLALNLAGGVLMFSLLYNCPQTALAQRPSDLDEHILKFRFIDYLFLSSALLLGITGVLINLQ